MPYRRSLRRKVSLTGEGVRSGRRVQVQVAPAAAGQGLRLARRDTAEAWPLALSAALPLPGCTAIGVPESHVAYVEHLLAACSALGLTDVLVTVDGPELPLLDGSAAPWLALLQRAGVEESRVRLPALRLSEPVTLTEPESCLLALPASRASFTYVLDHPHPLIGRQWAEFRPGREDFATELAPARTFTTAEEARRAQELGLLRGGSEDNAIVVYPDRYSAEPGLPAAFARHKLVDLIGDLYLLGRPVLARVIAYQTGHRQNQRLASALAEQAAAPGGD